MTAPRMPRHRAAIIPVGRRWYEFGSLRAAAVVAVGLAFFALYALVVTLLEQTL